MSEPKKHQHGSPPHVPTDETRQKVIDFSCSGFTHDQIAAYLDIDQKTLLKYYRYEATKAKLEKTAKLGGNLYLDALHGDKQAREFWLRTQGRWANARTPDEEKITNALLEKLIDKL